MCIAWNLPKLDTMLRCSEGTFDPHVMYVIKNVGNQLHNTAFFKSNYNVRLSIDHLRQVAERSDTPKLNPTDCSALW